MFALKIAQYCALYFADRANVDVSDGVFKATLHISLKIILFIQHFNENIFTFSVQKSVAGFVYGWSNPLKGFETVPILWKATLLNMK